MNEEILCYSGHLETPVGQLVVTSSSDAVHSVQFDAESSGGPRVPVLDEALRQLDAYFSDRLRKFDLPLAPAGTTFQRSVWQELQSIPFGETSTYGELAARLNKPTASRAVGGANHANPIAIVIPCHRVVGVGGALTGYAGGLERKAWLLRHEQGEH